MPQNHVHFDVELKDARTIAQYVESVSTADVDSEFIEEYFHGCLAVLKWVPLDDLKEDDPNSNVRDAEKENRYLLMPEHSCPPLLVENGIVKDGNHRLRVAKRNGYTGIWIYEVREITQLEQAPEIKPKRRMY